MWRTARGVLGSSAERFARRLAGEKKHVAMGGSC